MNTNTPETLADPLVENLEERSVLERIVAELAGGEPRPGQTEMVSRVESAIATNSSVVITAGTGTGKSLGYLIPSVCSGKRTVVATASKALQDQLGTVDLPFLTDTMAKLGLPPFTFAVLKGRSNYVCLAKLGELVHKQPELSGFDGTEETQTEQQKLVTWAEQSPTGDRAELEWEPSDEDWQQMSVSSDGCPGRNKCPFGETCYAERARAAAAEAQVVVVNMHLLGMHVRTAGMVVPPFETLIIDEAHELENILAESLADDVTPGSLAGAARTAGTLFQGLPAIDKLNRLAAKLTESARLVLGERLTGISGSSEGVYNTLNETITVLSVIMSATRQLPEIQDAKVALIEEGRRQRVIATLSNLRDRCSTLTLTLESGEEDPVVWVDGTEQKPVVRSAKVDVSEECAMHLWSGVSSVLTSATIPANIGEVLGLPEDTPKVDVGSPFNYQENAMLYVPGSLPDPRAVTFQAKVNETIHEIITLSGGRALVLFTSYRALNAAWDSLQTAHWPFTLLKQGQAPKMRLIERFAEDETSVLFATQSFFTGVNVPGKACSVVIIDKIPFPVLTDPLMQARRAKAGPKAFEQVDLPAAAMLLAQGVGRLIRTSTDRGMVCVLDPRLARSGYRKHILSALPPMRRVVDSSIAETFLATLNDPTVP